MSTQFKVGDVLRNTQGVRRRILAVRSTGYETEFPDCPGETFMSEDSNDPFFEWWFLEGGAPSRISQVRAVSVNGAASFSSGGNSYVAKTVLEGVGSARLDDGAAPR